jgi:hypothetical protein
MTNSRSGLDALRPRPLRVRAELLEPLVRVAEWLVAQLDDQGRLWCREHKLEHTGKSACAAILFGHLWLHGAGEIWLERAIGQGQRLVARLEREGTSPCHTFRPGRHDPFNCSNSVIDGGACSDALATLIALAGERLPADLRRSFAAASLLHARTYLRYAVLDKGIPAQRAWGLTGLAGAHALEADSELARAGIEAVGVLEAIQNPDGSYPYHPPEWGAGHPGAGDVSCFYQSRVTGFLIHSLEVLGRLPSNDLFAAPLVRGLDYLTNLVGPDGIKPGLVEAKPWYWGAEYEVASHVFDVHALASGARWFGRRQYADAALLSYRAWAEHLGPSGVPQSHLPAPGRRRSYQCPLFWAAHACWIARALPDLEQALASKDSLGWPPRPRSKGALDLSVVAFESAQVARLSDGRVSAFVRAARPPGNVHHGATRGAGLVRVVTQDADGRCDGDWLDRRPFAHAGQALPGLEGEWLAEAGGLRPRRAWANGGGELRFALWLARAEWRAGRHWAALSKPGDVLNRAVLSQLGTLVSSAYDRAPTWELLPDGLLLRARLCHPDGEAVQGSLVERQWRLSGQGLEIQERLISAGACRDIRYVPPQRAHIEEDLVAGSGAGRILRLRLG